MFRVTLGKEEAEERGALIPASDFKADVKNANTGETCLMLFLNTRHLRKRGEVRLWQ